MRSMSVLDRPQRPTPIVDVGVPLLVTAFFAYTSSYDVSMAQAVAALLLCWIPWAAYRNWLRGDRNNIPMFALLAAMFWLAYAVPFFWAKHVINGIFGSRVLPESTITDSLYLAVLGVVCLWLGMRVAGCFHWLPGLRADVSDSSNRRNYLRATFVVGTLVKAFVPITAFGEGGRQVVSNFENIVPVVGFAILVRYYLRGRIMQFDKFLIYTYGLIALVVGISSGWLGSFVGTGVVCAVVYVYERRKFPMKAALVVLPIILFFQPAKATFRERYWKEESSDSRIERAGFWVENSWALWNKALMNPDGEQIGEQIKELSNATLSRFSLLQQSANVIELTPSRVPYQYGSLYSYIAVTFVPRLFWPDKPSVNDANRWYQVTYGMTDLQHLSTVSIAGGTVAESYINFGWLGPLLIIVPLGFLLGSFERIFLHADSGLLFSCIGAVLVPQLLAIESQMAQYVAGLTQQVSLVLLILVPTLDSQAQAQKKAFRESVPLPYSLKPEMPTLYPSISRESVVRRESIGE
jgi:hypothetical protein